MPVLIAKWRHSSTSPAPTKVVQCATPVATTVPEPTPFRPPRAMQQALWDAIASGNFIDAKIFAFSRRSRKPGRVDTPKALFVNTHVLASACSYFESTFGFSGGIQTHLNEGPPPGIEPSFDLEECDSDSDFDDPVEEDPARARPKVSPDTSEPPQRSIKAYVVKYTAYKTLRAIVWYIYSGEISFSGGPPGLPSASAKSVYRFADEHGMEDLKTLASEAIESFIDQLSPSELVQEACSVSVSQCPGLRSILIERLLRDLSQNPGAKLAFQKKLSAYFRGELPHCKEVITSTLLGLLDDSALRTTCYKPAGRYSTIQKVSCPWPGRTKAAFWVSLDNGIFDDFPVAPGPAGTSHSAVYLSTAVTDEGVGSSFWRSRFPQDAARTLNLSPSTWQAFAYYTYTDCISFKPLGSEDIDAPTWWGPSDPQFRGYACSMKEMLGLARKFTYAGLMDLVTAKMVSSMSSITLEKVFEETFSGPPLPPKVINRGLEILCDPSTRKSARVQSRLRETLEEAASGSRLDGLSAFSMYFDKVLASADF